MIRIVLPI
ncbi:hypothetical protein CGLO_15715 [Colletotrichum gloeosporioides Cg-14]|uniref:Uncharacterized protein n=1 Tax=Colletotrichum gloeosporioides (strain Cg-14) TaxID=1237896 RepID=T0LAU0_COLGC|nr:hypothetical protein CGLO_15715 [Colletotrichum gloeosporioides Cg-14]